MSKEYWLRRAPHIDAWPEGYDWWSCDKNGDSYYYEEMPMLDDPIWFCELNEPSVDFGSAEKWEESLITRAEMEAYCNQSPAANDALTEALARETEVSELAENLWIHVADISLKDCFLYAEKFITEKHNRIAAIKEAHK